MVFTESSKIKNNNKVVFGDFQTPYALAWEVIQFLKMSEDLPTIVIEPTCGLGSFLKASIAAFGNEVQYYGFDINLEYIQETKKLFSPTSGVKGKLYCEDFFKRNWESFFFVTS